MELKKLTLKSFRNYRELEFRPGPGINLLIGQNAQGKTNLLEALYYLSTFSSPRANTDSELVFWGEPSFYVQGIFQIKGDPLILEAGYSAPEGRKEVRVNRQPAARLSMAVSKVNTVFFTPEDLYMIKGYPQVRRQFLDREIAQVTPLYGQQLSLFSRILRQRNRLLRDVNRGFIPQDPGRMEVWDSQLAETAAYILWRRKEYAQKLSLLARLQHRKLTSGREELSLIYLSSLEALQGTGRASREDIRADFLDALKKGRTEEIRRGMTLVGPHRDDLEIRINSRPARTYGSQGQQRTSVLALKLAQVELLYGEKGGHPLLLLDDVFSELDRERQEGLLAQIRGRVQTFITGTGDGLRKEPAFRDGLFYRVFQGRVSAWKS